MNASARPRTSGGAAAVGVVQCALLAVGSLVVVTWAFVEVTKRLALTTTLLDSESDRVLFGALVGGVTVLVLASVAALLLWRGRTAGFVVLGLAWVPSVPLAWLTVRSYLDLVVDDRMPAAIALSLVLAASNIALGRVLRVPTTPPGPPVAD